MSHFPKGGWEGLEMALPWFVLSHSDSLPLTLDTLQPPTVNWAGEFWSYLRNSPPQCAPQDLREEEKWWEEFFLPKVHSLWLEPRSPRPEKLCV